MTRHSNDDDEGRSRLLLIGGVLGGLLLLALLAVLIAVLAVLEDSREHIESQDAKISAIYDATEPAFEDVPGLVGAVEPLVRDVQPLVRDAGPVLDELSGAGSGISDVTQSLPPVLEGIQTLVEVGAPLASDLRASDLPGLVSSLQASDLPELTGSAEQLIAALSTNDRLTRTLDIANFLFADIVAKDLPRRAVRSSERLQDLLKVQRRARRILGRSFRLQIRILDRVRSIDDKFGGEFPPGSP